MCAQHSPSSSVPPPMLAEESGPTTLAGVDAPESLCQMWWISSCILMQDAVAWPARTHRAAAHASAPLAVCRQQVARLKRWGYRRLGFDNSYVKSLGRLCTASRGD